MTFIIFILWFNMRSGGFIMVGVDLRGEVEHPSPIFGKDRQEGGEGEAANSLAAMSPHVNLSPWIVQMGVM